jgi:murein DD-endopeptidase MepM/ murein hydrolase activator NlpD
MIRIFTLILFFSCSQITTLKPRENESKKEDKILSMTLHLGQVSLFKYHLKNNEKKVTGFVCDNKKQYYFIVNNTLQALMFENYFGQPRQYECYLQVNGEKKVVAHVSVLEFDYPSEKLNVDPKRVFLSKKDQARVDREQVMLNKIYATKSNSIYFKNPFILPLESFITSDYGKKRVFNNAKKSQHLGTDFRAAVGEPIPVSNDGKVVFAGDLFYTGLTVIVHHGFDIFSVYGHLSKLKSQKGDFVRRGDVIALSGATGRVSGPHLHWGVKISGQYVDGVSLVKSTQDAHF